MPQGAYKHLVSKSEGIHRVYDSYLDMLLSADVDSAKVFCREKGIPLASLQLIRLFLKHNIPFDSLDKKRITTLKTIYFCIIKFKRKRTSFW